MVPNSVEVLVCYPPRLVIDAFAQPYRHPRLNQTDDVLEAAPEVGLYHGAGVLVALVHVQNYLDGRGRKGRVLHIHPHKAISLRGILYDLLQVRPAQLLVKEQPEPGQLDRDTRFELVFIQSVEDHLVQRVSQKMDVYTVTAMFEETSCIHCADRRDRSAQRFNKGFAASCLRLAQQSLELREGFLYGVEVR